MKTKIMIAGALFALANAGNSQNTFPTPNGNVGIGTTSPVQLLDVRGNSTFGGGATPGSSGTFQWTPNANEQTLLVSGANNGGSNGYGTIVLGSNTPEGAGQFLGGLVFAQKISGKSAFTAPGLKAAIRAISDGNGGSTGGFGGDLTFCTMADNSNSGLIERMRIDLNGKVGIGTNGPSAKLDVRDATKAEIYAYTTSPNPANVWAMNAYNSYGLSVDAAGVGHIMNNVNGPFKLMNFQQTNSAPQVWIGTKPTSAHTDFSFAVGGKIVAQSVYVTLNCTWADYVFDKNYELPKLSDVESYYKANKHLPEIPTAKEVEEQGVDVAKMNALLLKKVEELTLYVVEQQKQIGELKAKQNQEK